MKFTVTIRNNETGEIKVHKEDYEWQDDIRTINGKQEFFGSAFDGFTYHWSEGNFGCDCNRAILMYGYDKEAERKCSTGKFDIIKIMDEDGDEYPIDEFNEVDERS